VKKISTLMAFVLIGCYSIIVQVLFIREFMVVFLGSELCLGIIFASWLIGISLGAAIGARIIRRLEEIWLIFIVSQAVICVVPFFQIYFIRIIREILRIPPGEYISLAPLTASTFLLILPFSFMIGLIFPCASKLSVGKADSVRKPGQGYSSLQQKWGGFLSNGVKNKAQQIGRVYILEAVGSLIGGLALTFYLITHFRPYETLSAISLLISANCLILSLSHKNIFSRVASTFYIILFLAFNYLLISGNVAKLDDLFIQKRWEAYHNHLVMTTSIDSLYQNIVVATKEDQYSLFSNGQYMLSFPDPYQSAVFAHFLLSQHSHPHKVLLVGGGVAGTIGEILKHPVTLLHYVELDPRLIEASLPFLPLEDRKALEDKRVEVFYTDGRYYTKNAKEKYDMIILNLPDPSTAMLNRFYTLEFFEEIKEILNDDGIVVTGITSAVNYIGEEVGVYTSSLYHTLKRVFPYIIIVPGSKNYFFAASTPNVVTSDCEVLAERYQSRHISSDYFTPYHFTMLLPEERVKFIKRALEKKSDVRINTDSHPVTYFYNLVLWEIFSGKRGEGNIFQNLSGGLTWFVFPLLVMFFVRIVYVLLKKERVSHHLKFNGLLAIATTGFAGMALEIILLFAFQNTYGYVYQKVGLIVALFMLGLSLGGYLMNQLISGKERNWIKILIINEFLICIYSLCLPYITTLFSASATISLEYLFMILVVGAGLLTGLEFPLVSRIFIDHAEVGTVAGWVDSFDHLGACFGAILTGTILVPLLGTYLSCLFTGALNLMSGLLLMIYLLQKRE
jgi:spermidine synthase